MDKKTYYMLTDNNYNDILSIKNQYGYFYFTDIKHIFEIVNNDVYFINRITIPGTVEVVEEFDIPVWKSKHADVVERTKFNDVDLIKKLIYEGAVIKENNSAILCYAASVGNLEMILLLMDCGINLKIVGGKAKIIAAEYGFLNIIELLTDMEVNENDEEAYITACKHNQIEAVRYFLNRQVYDSGDKGLNVAADNGFLRIIKLIVKYRGFNFDIYGKYILIGAAANGHLNVVKYFSKKGCDLNSPPMYYFDAYKPDFQKTAIVQAVENGHLDVVKFLIISKINCHSSFLVQLAIKKNHTEIVKYLFKTKQVCLSLDYIELAISNGNLEIIHLLFENGMTFSDETLIKSIDYGHVPIVQFLVNIGSKINHKLYDIEKVMKNNEMMNYLIIDAVKKNNLEIVKIYCERDFEIDAMNLMLHIYKFHSKSETQKTHEMAISLSKYLKYNEITNILIERLSNLMKRAKICALEDKTSEKNIYVESQTNSTCI